MISYRWWYAKGEHPTTGLRRLYVWEGWFLFWIIPIVIKQMHTTLEV